MPDDIACQRPVRVVIVDDTRSIRAMIRENLRRSTMIEVVGEAADPYEARELIRELSPDVITLDVVMPRMNGLSFLERLMRLRPMPVVMVSSRTTENSQEAIKALSLGAVDCVDRAMLNAADGSVDLAETVLMAAKSNVGAFSGLADMPGRKREKPFNWNGRSVVIGSSTGGVDALLNVVSTFPQDCAPTVIAQHMPAEFLESFANRLDRSCTPSVCLATDGDALKQGQVLLAPGGDGHVALSRRNPRKIRILPHVGTEDYVPSVNVLFSSAVPHKDNVVGALLTGMGRDGAEALLKMRRAGAHTIVQDGASSVVDGMPRSARDIGAAVEVATLSKIGQRINASVSTISEEGRA